MAQRARDVAKKVAQDARAGGRQPHDKGVTKAAKAIGISRDTVRRSKTIAAISSAAKKAAKDTNLTDNEAALLKVAKEPTPKAQVRKVRELAKPKGAAPKPELSRKERKQLKQLKRAFAELVGSSRAWRQTCEMVRNLLIAHIRKLASSV